MAAKLMTPLASYKGGNCCHEAANLKFAFAGTFYYNLIYSFRCAM